LALVDKTAKFRPARFRERVLEPRALTLSL
jgi:hypothetical protein